VRIFFNLYILYLYIAINSLSKNIKYTLIMEQDETYLNKYFLIGLFTLVIVVIATNFLVLFSS